MSSTTTNPGADPEDAPEFPDTLPPSVQINVPRPSGNHTDWTSDPYTSVDMPPTFDDLVDLVDHQEEPALYAAAVDTIRMTNRYFDLVGSYSSERSRRYPLTEKLVLEKLRTWPETVDEDGKRTKLSPAANYPEPPDPRTLFVKEAMGDPTDEKRRALWVRACRDVQRMSGPTWERYLSYTRQELIDRTDARVPKDESWLILELFKRYLVWNELVEGATKRAIQFEEEQPTWAQMEQFFNREDVKEKGATFVEICHAFPHARDSQMLVYRIERFATLTKQSSVKTKAGIDDPVESRYMPKLAPTKDGVRLAASSLMSQSGSISLEELADQYWPSREHNPLIRNVLETFARPDVTTGRFILMKNEPTHQEMEEVIEQADYLNGFSLREFARRFPNRVWSIHNFHRTMSGFVYLDEAEGRYYPRAEDEGNSSRLSPEQSLISRNEARVRLTFTPVNLYKHYRWDRELLRYVPRVKNLQLGGNSAIGAQFDDFGSPTETDYASTTAGTPPSEPANTISNIVAVEITPISPLTAAPVPPVDEPPAGSPRPAADTGRGKKREAIEEPVDSLRDKKKPRKTSKIQCSGRTLKNTTCKKQKEREEGEEDWNCGKHRKE